MDTATIQDLVRILKSLANPNRVQLLVALQRPQRLSEIDLTPSRESVWGGNERPISRQAVKQHIEALVDIGALVQREEGSEVRYVVDHARLYGVTEQLRELATVRPDEPAEKATIDLDLTGLPQRHQGPHLVLVRGVREGQVWPLPPEGPTKDWLIGRHRDAAVCLDYDPYVSNAHARVLRKEDNLFLVDLRSNRNGTYLNWQKMVRAGVAPLKPGDLIGVGMSLLLYRT